MESNKIKFMVGYRINRKQKQIDVKSFFAIELN